MSRLNGGRVKSLESILEGLNAEQKEVALHSSGPLLVLAVAGSGKTRAIAHRAACLISAHGVSPSHILCLTFTNKAAGEMRERIGHLLGGQSRGMTVSTFHALCARILREHHVLIPRSRRFVIYDQEDAGRLAKEVAKELGAPGCEGQLLADIEGLKNRGILPADGINGLSDQKVQDNRHSKLLQEAYRLYEKKMVRYDALDFTDLLLKTILMLDKHPKVLEGLRQRFRYILVDEYQDTCPLQERLLKLLSAPAYNLCTVGDDDQAIYAFRHADSSAILTFQSRYPGATVIRMEENYRSTGSIIRLARRVISANRHRHPKSIRTLKEGGLPVSLTGFPSEEDEAAWIRAKVQKLKMKGCPYTEMAVLCRVASLFRPLERELANHLIPYSLVDGLAFWERREVKDVMAYLRLVHNPQDYLSFKRIANVPTRGLGKRTLQRIEQALKTRPMESLPDILRESACHSRPLRLFLHQLETLRNAATNLNGLIRAVLERIGYEAHIAKAFSDAERRVGHLMQLCAMARRFEEEQGGDLGEFLLQAGLGQESEDEAHDAVRLMTIHAAKGLEFGSVFVLGLEDGILPHARCRDNIEEERRLFYVAVTRTKERLFLSWSTRRVVHGREMSHLISPFVNEAAIKDESPRSIPVEETNGHARIPCHASPPGLNGSG